MGGQNAHSQGRYRQDERLTHKKIVEETAVKLSKWAFRRVNGEFGRVTEFSP